MFIFINYIFLQSQTEVDEEKLRSLEKDLKKEKERADKSEQEYFTLKVFHFCLINIFGYDR